MSSLHRKNDGSPLPWQFSIRTCLYATQRIEGQPTKYNHSINYKRVPEFILKVTQPLIIKRYVK
jgi:hypothetical protein